MTTIRTRKKSAVIKSPLHIYSFDVLGNFNTSRYHLKKETIRFQIEEENYLMFTDGVDSSARSRKLAKYAMTSYIKT